MLMQYYEAAYEAARAQNWTGDIWVHDGFAYSDAAWDGFMPPPAFYNVYIDTHLYHCFGGARQQPTVRCSSFTFSPCSHGRTSSTRAWTTRR